jgi:tetratricopeptide (TPR) repeat protein
MHVRGAAALRALAVDDACADAQVALGAVSFLGQRDWVGAERSLQRALEISPNHTEAYVLYGRLLDALGRLQDGLEMKMCALERDPFSPFVHQAIALSYWNQRRYEDSITWANKTLELDPRHLVAREHLAGAYWAMGDFDRQMEENVKDAEFHGVAADALEPIKQAYAAGGRAGAVRWVLETQGSHLRCNWLCCMASWATWTRPSSIWSGRSTLTNHVSSISPSLRCGITCAPTAAFTAAWRGWA